MKNTKKKIPKAFIGFLIASFLIWLLITLSKEYNSIVTYKVSYNNLPQDKLLQEKPLDKLDFSLRASGFKIISTKFRDRTIGLDASKLQKSKNGQFYFLANKQLNSIQNQLISGVQVEQILKDTIYLNLGLLTSKKVALKPQLEINYHIGYDATDKIKITPDSIVVSGPENKINELQELYLAKFTLNDVKEDFKRKTAILIPDSLNTIKISTKEVIISGKVEQFTEGKINIPFTIKNLPKNTELTSLSKTVEIIYIVALPNFTKITDSSFKVECDFNISKENNLSYLIPKMVDKPAFVKSYKIVPSKIDFLIQK